MSGLRKLPWLRISAEGIAIVVSILLAFWIQAWWENRQGRVELHEILHAILGDLKSSRKVIEGSRNQLSAQQDAIVKLLEIATNESSSPDEAQIDGLLRDVNWFVQPSPVTAASLDMIISTGMLASIEDDELRTAIADLPAVIDYNEHNIAQDYEYLTRQFWPYVARNSNWLQINAAHNRWPGRPEREYQTFPLQVSKTRAHSQLLAEPEFQNILFYGWEVKADALGTHNYVDRRLAATIELLEQELNPLN
jgi:hypothetical protein